MRKCRQRKSIAAVLRIDVQAILSTVPTAFIIHKTIIYLMMMKEMMRIEERTVCFKWVSENELESERRICQIENEI